jgi:hypothetical protein
LDLVPWSRYVPCQHAAGEDKTGDGGLPQGRGQLLMRKRGMGAHFPEACMLPRCDNERIREVTRPVCLPAAPKVSQQRTCLNALACP